MRRPWYHFSSMLMLGDTHTHIRTVHNDAVQMHFQIVCTRRFFFFNFFSNRGDRQKSKTGSVGDEAQCSTVLCFFFFLDFLVYTCTKASCRKMFEYIAFLCYITSVFLTQLQMWINQNRSREHVVFPSSSDS